MAVIELGGRAVDAIVHVVGAAPQPNAPGGGFRALEEQALGQGSST